MQTRSAIVSVSLHCRLRRIADRALANSLSLSLSLFKGANAVEISNAFDEGAYQTTISCYVNLNYFISSTVNLVNWLARSQNGHRIERCLRTFQRIFMRLDPHYYLLASDSFICPVDFQRKGFHWKSFPQQKLNPANVQPQTSSRRTASSGHSLKSD